MRGFRRQFKDPFGKYGKYYVFREGKDGKEPNNWRSIFGGRHGRRYRDMITCITSTSSQKEQPDLNWEKPGAAGRNL